MEKLRVGILGARGEVGQNYISLLQGHEWFEVTALTGSTPADTYGESVEWYQQGPRPNSVENLPVLSSIDDVLKKVDFVFSALPTKIAAQQEADYAKHIPVISYASVHRGDPYVPMIIPEINSHHAKIIPAQQEHYGREGFIATKPNCSIQSFMLPLYALMNAGMKPRNIILTTEQAMSGAGRDGLSANMIHDNTTPLPGEARKAKTEPNKILGSLSQNGIISTEYAINAICSRVPISDGHKANVFIEFKSQPNKEDIIRVWENFPGLHLPSAPQKPLQYLHQSDRPQPKQDKFYEGGMGISIGGLEVGSMFTQFSSLSHNTIRGAAGGAILMAEQLVDQGYIKH